MFLARFWDLKFARRLALSDANFKSSTLVDEDGGLHAATWRHPVDPEASRGELATQWALRKGRRSRDLEPDAIGKAVAEHLRLVRARQYAGLRAGGRQARVIAARGVGAALG